MEPKDNIKIEHAIANSKIIEKLEHKIEHRVGKIEEKMSVLELIMSRAAGITFGMSLVIVSCCCILGWCVKRGIDNNDKIIESNYKMNEIQTTEINQIKMQIVQLQRLEIKSSPIGVQ